MKKVMFTYNYHRKRAIMRRDQTGHRIIFGVISAAVLYGAFCLRTLVRA